MISTIKLKKQKPATDSQAGINLHPCANPVKLFPVVTGLAQGCKLIQACQPVADNFFVGQVRFAVGLNTDLQMHKFWCFGPVGR